MKQLPAYPCVGAAMTVVLAASCLSLSGCGSTTFQTFLEENACRIFNCDTLFLIDDVIEATGAADDQQADGDEHDDMDMDGGDTGDEHAHGDDGDSDDQAAECDEDLGATPTKASEWVSFVNWDEATRVEMSAHEVSETACTSCPTTWSSSPASRISW